MRYQLKGGEEIQDGKLYGWTGRDCRACGGSGVDEESGQLGCRECAGTGDEWGLLPEQPKELQQITG